VVESEKQRAKRLLDCVLVVSTLPLWLPVVCIVGVVCWGVWGRPILFRQQRIGLGGDPFELMKFRSMTLQRDKVGNLLSDEQRLTRFGRVLRATSLDELPQLINVLRGDMSLVGPRPLLPEYLPRYSKTERRRHEVRPGLTGWAQVNGRNELSWERKFELDVWYVAHQSMWLDVKILGMTVAQVLARRSISAPNHVTMEPFLGPPMTKRGRDE
jgi:sugar transferase EpsL